MWTHGKVYWNELMTTDVEAAKAFYAATLGWSFNPMPMPEGTYYVVMLGEDLVGGMMQMTPDMPAGTPSHWFTYFAVSDIDVSVAALVAAGGKVIRPAWDIPEIGRIAIVQDPTGTAMGWMTPAPMPMA